MSDENVTKRMGQMLRNGAALLSLACPRCNTPLLRLRDGSMFCAKCNQEVIAQSTMAPSHDQRQAGSNILNQLATKVLLHLEHLTESLPDKAHPEEIRAFAVIARDLIEILRGIQELQSK